MRKYSDFVLDQAGNALSGASVQVYLTGTTTPASIFSDNGITSKTNPISTAGDGNFFFFAANGIYDLVITKTGYVFNSANTARVTLYDPVDALAVGSASVGSALFKGPTGIEQDNPGIFWDAPNNRLGLGTATPATTIHISQPSSAVIFLSQTDPAVTLAASAFINLTAGGGGAGGASSSFRANTALTSNIDFLTRPNTTIWQNASDAWINVQGTAKVIAFATDVTAYYGTKIIIRGFDYPTSNKGELQLLGGTLLSFIGTEYAGSPLTSDVFLKHNGSGGFIIQTGGLNDRVEINSVGSLRVFSSGPHAIGGATDSVTQFYLRGTFAGGQDGQLIQTTLEPAANATARLFHVAGTINEAASGTHADFVGAQFTAPIIGAAAGALTNASTVKITGAPTGATNNRALWVLGTSEFKAAGFTDGSIATFGGLIGKFLSVGYDTAADYGFISSSEFGTNYKKLVLNGATIELFIAATAKVALNSSGKLAVGTTTVQGSSAISAQSSDVNTGISMWNTNETNGASVPLYLAGENSDTTISNVSIEALTVNGANCHMVFRTGGSGTAITNGTERMRLTNGGVLLIGTTVVATADVGDVVIGPNNGGELRFVNAAGTGTVSALYVNASNQVVIGIEAADIRWGRDLIALGGGATPTFGTIGGSGPATAAQNSWMKVIDSTGAAFYVPAWK